MLCVGWCMMCVGWCMMCSLVYDVCSLVYDVCRLVYDVCRLVYDVCRLVYDVCSLQLHSTKRFDMLDYIPITMTLSSISALLWLFVQFRSTKAVPVLLNTL
jgi:predicted solute-binding protein